MIYNNKLKTILAIVFMGFFAQSASAYVAGSLNYRIDTDTISIGGLRSTSTSYTEQSTLPSGISGPSAGTLYAGSLGYLQAVDSYISLSTSAGVTMSPDIKLTGGGQSTGSGSATVTTDSPNGYTLSINAGTNPAFKSSSSSFLDYVTGDAGVTPDFTWSVASNSTGFGFSPEGGDVASLFKDNSIACGVGTGNITNKCWYPLGTSLKTIAQASAPNNPSGTLTTIKFMAEAGSSVRQPAGSYSATITLTAMAL